MTASRARRRAAFTMVEIMFGTAVMAAVMIGVYQLFSSMNRQTSQAAWISVAQKACRNSMKRVHDELTKASYWTRLEPNDVVYLDQAGNGPQAAGSAARRAAEEAIRQTYWVSDFGPPDQDNETVPGGEQETLVWYQSEPGKAGFSTPDEEGFVARCALVLDGEKLLFRRQLVNGDAAAANPIEVELADNVESVIVRVESKADDTDAVLGTVVTLTMTMHHPNTGKFPNTRVTQSISARVPVGYEGQP